MISNITETFAFNASSSENMIDTIDLYNSSFLQVNNDTEIEKELLLSNITDTEKISPNVTKEVNIHETHQVNTTILHANHSSNLTLAHFLNYTEQLVFEPIGFQIYKYLGFPRTFGLNNTLPANFTLEMF